MITIKRTKKITSMLILANIVGSSYGAVREYINIGYVRPPTIIGSALAFTFGIAIIYFVTKFKSKSKATKEVLTNKSAQQSDTSEPASPAR